MAGGLFDPQILVPLGLDPSDGGRWPIGRILLVDGDPVVHELTSGTLRRAGHVVVDADRGPAALRELELDHEGFDLLITNLVMPGMTGMELAGRARIDRPSLPVLFISRYSDELVVHAAVVQAFEAQPYSAEGLIETVASLLRTSGLPEKT
jgi:CheY-like chemotaxis protein